MKAMVLEAPGQALQLRHRPDPVAGPGQLLVSISACGVCRTDLHIVDGDHRLTANIEEINEYLRRFIAKTTG